MGVWEGLGGADLDREAEPFSRFLAGEAGLCEESIQGRVCTIWLYIDEARHSAQVVVIGA